MPAAGSCLHAGTVCGADGGCPRLRPVPQMEALEAVNTRHLVMAFPLDRRGWHAQRRRFPAAARARWLRPQLCVRGAPVGQSCTGRGTRAGQRPALHRRPDRSRRGRRRDAGDAGRARCRQGPPRRREGAHRHARRQGAAGAVAHLRYLQRDGTTREGERGTLYGPNEDRIDGTAFLERERRPSSVPLHHLGGGWRRL